MSKQNHSLDILHGSLWRSIPLFAIPVAATSILEQVSNLIDTVMIGHFSGEGGALGMAAVGSNTPIASLLINLFVGISLGANVAVAHAVGAGDSRRARRCAHTAVSMSVLGVILVVVMELASETLLHALDVPVDTFADALAFLRIYCLGLPAILLYNMEAALFRSVGITQMPLYALALSAVLNIVLDAIFVPVLGWGAGGVALATVLCYVAIAAFLFWRLCQAHGVIGIVPRELGIDMTAFVRIMRIGLPAGLQSAVFAIANIVIQRCINSLGTEVVAASSAALALELVFYSLLNSFSQACTTFVGQACGARDYARCRRVLKTCLVEDALVAAVMITGVVASGRAMLGVFNGDPTVIELGYVRVCTIFPAYVFSMIYENVSGYLRGFGISTAPAVLTVLGVCGVRLLWVAFVFARSRTFQTVMYAYPVSLGITCLLLVAALALFRPAATAGKKGVSR